MKYLIIVGLFILCSCGNNNTVMPKVLMDSTNTSIFGNNSDYMNILHIYTNFQINNKKLKYQIGVYQYADSIGFSMRSNNDTILIKGDALEGVCYFLNKYAGVRFYLPGKDWYSLPKYSIMVDSIIDLIHKPFTAVISSSGYKTSDENAWARENNISNAKFGYTGHTMSMLFYDSSCLKLFPDIYSQGFPKSTVDQNFEPDFTKPDIVAASMYVSRKFFIKHPTMNYIGFAVMDSYSGYAPPLPDETLQHTFIKFLNNLADSFAIALPGKKITYAMYGNVNGVPDIPVNPLITPIATYQISNIIDDKILDTPFIKNMAVVFSSLGNHDWAQGAGFIVPRTYSHLLQSFLKLVNYEGIDFKFGYMEMYPNWGLDGIKGYEMAQIYDNPFIDIDSMRISICNDLFGNGSLAMEGYFNAVENLTTSMNTNYSFERKLYNYPSQMELDSADYDVVISARYFLNQAMNLTSGESHFRVNFLSNGFKISEGLWKIYNEKPVDTSFISSYENFLRDSIAGNEMYLNIASDSTTFMNTMINLVNQIK